MRKKQEVRAYPNVGAKHSLPKEVMSLSILKEKARVKRVKKMVTQWISKQKAMIEMIAQDLIQKVQKMMIISCKFFYCFLSNIKDNWGQM